MIAENNIIEKIKSFPVGMDSTCWPYGEYPERGEDFTLFNLVQDYLIYRGIASVKNSDLHANEVFERLQKYLTELPGS